MIKTPTLLQAIKTLGHEATGTKVRQLLSDESGTEYPSAVVYVALQIAEARGLILSKSAGKPSRRLYEVVE